MSQRIKQTDPPKVDFDMTPMIDMTFQLIAFFMMVINFKEMERTQRVTLPQSTLAIVPEDNDQYTFGVIHVDDKDDVVVFKGQEYKDLKKLQEALRRWVAEIKAQRERKMENVIVVVRGDRLAKTELVQKVIETCQAVDLKKFRLRANKQEDG